MPESKPLCIDLFCGLGGWSEGFLAEGYHCIGFDNERHDYGTGGYPGELVLQDVLTLHGSQFSAAAVIVASPPCTEFSYMAMPWKRGKQIAAALRGDIGEADGILVPFPDGYTGSRTLSDLTALFDACFRIQREASEAAGHHIPLIVENVKGAQRWVGRAPYHYGSFYLWGDIPALMPWPQRAWKSKHTPLVETPVGTGATSWTRGPVDGCKIPREDRNGGDWFDNGAAAKSSKSNARKMVSAQIAKIPLPLSQHIARVFHHGNSRAC